MFRWWTSSLFVFIGLGLLFQQSTVLSQQQQQQTTTVTTSSSSSLSSSSIRRQKNTNHLYYEKSIIPSCSITTTSSLLRSAFVSLPHHPCCSTTRVVAYNNNPFLHQPKFNTNYMIMKNKKKHRILLPLYESTPSSSSNQDNTQKDDDDDDVKFGWKQRWASVQCLVLGAIVGSIASAPISLLHNLSNDMISNPIAQWEYNTDSNAIIGGLFAIVYRYCIRQDQNVQLKQGCISAMILIRTLPQIHIPSYCTSVPLNCHDHNNSHDKNIILQLLPFQYYYIFDDTNVIQQLLWCGLESTILFTVVAQMMDMAMEQKYIIRFPG